MAFVPAAVFGAFTAGGGAALQDWMSGFVAPDKVEEAVVEEVKGSVECVIEKYEASLAAHPLRAVRQVAPQAAVASPVEGRDGLSSAKDMSPKPNF